MSAYKIGVDVGGTFTDFILVTPRGSVELTKSPTTPGDEAQGVLNGIALLAAQEKLDMATLLAKTDLVVHGTTTADNTLIQMNGAKTGLLTTEGHRDQIEIRRGYKENIWDPALGPPTPIAPRRRRFGLPERLDFHGKVVRALDEDTTRQAIRRLKKQGVESVAICLLFSYLNPAHENRVRALVAEEMPGVRVSVSHEVQPTAPEFERTSTTLVDAYVGPRVEAYLRRLAGALREAGYTHELLIMQSNGGIMNAEFVARRAVTALGSGPTGGVQAACAVAKTAGCEDFIAVDMGGTSYEVCLIRGGRPNVKSFWNWFQRYLIGLPMVEMHAIGAGGGSIAHVEAGALKVGPQSAGANPGPVCYGRGGTQPTVTDANAVLGYVNPKSLCGGAFALRLDGVEQALSTVGRPLGLDAVATAAGIFRIVNANMSNAIRRVTSHAGIDPRELSLVVYGGNGPVHAGKQAEDLGIKRLIVPRTSPAFSALGLLIADYVVDAQRAYIVPAARARTDEINTRLNELEAEALQDLGKAGLEREAILWERFIHLAYPGQTFDIPVAIGKVDRPVSEEDLRAAVERFHVLHEEAHTYAVRTEEPVLRAVRLKAVGQSDKPKLPVSPAATQPVARAEIARRKAFFDGKFVDTPIYDGEKLGQGHTIAGPAIIEERFTTVVVYPGHTAALDGHGNYIITL